jgi:hypothetical protein
MGDKKGNPLNSDSMQNLLEAGEKNYQSSTNLDIREARLKRKAADMLKIRLDDS